MQDELFGISAACIRWEVFVSAAHVNSDNNHVVGESYEFKTGMKQDESQPL